MKFTQETEKHPALSDCLMKIAREHVKTKKFVFLEEEVRENYRFDRILKLNWEKVIVSVSNVSKVSGLYIFLPDNNATVSYEKILKMKSEDYNSMYIICTNIMNNIYLFFEGAWHYNIIDAVALYPSSRTNLISVYTYFPFGDWGCSTTDPVRIDIYQPYRRNFQSTDNVFSKRDKLYNLHKCPVRITLKDAPEVIGKIGQEEFRGVPIALLHHLQEKLNFTPVVVYIDKEANTYAAAYYNFTSAAVLNIVKKSSDLAVGDFSQLIDDHEKTQAPVQTSMDCFTWAVPIKAGNAPSVWTTYLYEFDLLAWLLILLLFVICVFVVKTISRMILSPYTNPTMLLFAMMITISVNMKIKSSTMKVFIAHWLLFCLVVVAAYSASLGSLVTVPPDSTDIKSTTELLEKEIGLTGEPKMYHILSASSDTSIQIKKVLKKFIILRPGEFETILHDIYTERKLAVFYTKNNLIREEKRVKKEKQIHKLIHIVPDCLVRSHTAPLLMRKGAILLVPVKSVVVRLLENGLINYWSNFGEDNSLSQATANKAQKFTVSQLRGALIVIISGHILSSIVFLYELYSDKVKLKSPLLGKGDKKANHMSLCSLLTYKFRKSFIRCQQ